MRTIEPPEDFVPAKSKRRFVIASADYFEMTVLPDLVAYLHEVAPNMSIEMELISSRFSAQRLEEHSVDLLVGLNGADEVSPHLVQEPWISEEQICLVSENNESVKRELSFEQHINSSHDVFVDLRNFPICFWGRRY